MNQKEIIYFTAGCLALDLKPENKNSISEDFRKGITELDDFIFFCSNQLILPAVYLQLNKHEILSTFPEEYKFHIAALYLQNKKRNLDILKQIEEINKVLATENIKAVYLKGTANLLDTVYSDVGERMIGDIDLLVQDKDYLKAAELIQYTLGYKTDEKVYSDVTEDKHFPRVYRPDVPADIEIHRLAVNNKYSKEFNTAEIFENKKEIKGKPNCFVPSDDHKIIHSFIHARLSNGGHRFKTLALRDLYDFYLLSKRVNPAEVISRVKNKKELQCYFSLFNKVFNPAIKLPFETNKNIKKYIQSYEKLAAKPRRHRVYILFQKLAELFFSRIPIYIFRFLTNKKIRKGARERILDLDWYKTILFRFRNFYGNFIAR